MAYLKFFALTLAFSSSISWASFAHPERAACLPKEFAVVEFEDWKAEYVEAMEASEGKPLFRLRILKAGHGKLIDQIIRVEELETLQANGKIMREAYKLQRRLQVDRFDTDLALTLVNEQIVALKKELAILLDNLQDQNPQCRFKPTAGATKKSSGAGLR